jgi:hypothetical protein
MESERLDGCRNNPQPPVIFLASWRCVVASHVFRNYRNTARRWSSGEQPTENDGLGYVFLYTSVSLRFGSIVNSVVPIWQSKAKKVINKL